jgi:pimeloyl-ACP methyl ester carboxylesterase
MGGYLAPRAAAFDERVDGVVAFDVFFDFGAISSRSVPAIASWFGRHGLGFFLNPIAKIKAAFSPSLRWALQNTQWVMGTHGTLEAVEALRAYTLQDVAQCIHGDVLIFAGEEDHFVPIEQLKQFEKSLTQARSVTSVSYDRESGGAEHCQLGAVTLWHAALFDWLLDKFPLATNCELNSPESLSCSRFDKCSCSPKALISKRTSPLVVSRPSRSAPFGLRIPAFPIGTWI